MASSSSSSSGGDDDRRRRRAERRFLRACRKGSLRKAKRRLRRCPTLDLECRVPRGVRSGADAGRTPLHLACAAGAEDLLRWLVKLGADVTPPDDAGDTPAHLLARHAASRPTALDALRRAGADVHRVRDARGETPSDIAARRRAPDAKTPRGGGTPRRAKRRGQTRGRRLGGSRRRRRRARRRRRVARRSSTKQPSPREKVPTGVPTGVRLGCRLGASARAPRALLRLLRRR